MAKSDLTFRIFGKDVSASKTLKGVGKTATGVFAGISMAAVVGQVKDFAVESVKAFSEAQSSQAKFDQSLDKNGLGAYKGQIDALAQSLATKTKFDDDATKSSAALLSNFGLTGDQLTSLIPLVQDYAAFTGKDLDTSATLMGKALNGNAKALKALGINFKPTGDKVKDLATLQDLLSKKVGGFAQKEGKTAAGQAAILGNQYGELQETVGSALLPILTTLGTFLIEDIVPAFQSVAQWIGENSDVLIPLVTVIGGFMAVMKVATIVQGAYAAIVAAGTVATAGATTAQWSLNAALLANPVGLVVAAIAILIGAIILLWNKNETFRNIVTAVWQGVQAAISAVVDWFKNTAWPAIKTVIGFIVGYYTTLWNTFKNVASWIIEKGWALVGWFRDLPWRISAAVSGLWNGLKSGFKSVLNWIIEKWNGLSLTLGGIEIPLPAGKSITIPSVSLDTPNIPLLASGGIVRATPGGILANIGEGRYDEAVVPLKPGMGLGGHQIVIAPNVLVLGGNRAAAGRDLAKLIADAESNGSARRRKGA